ncbi:unnamed protein product [Rhodiola kirilowii]
MFPICLKWVDDIYGKLESVVDDIISKDQDSSKYVEGLKNVGTNVKQFYSTADPLKYVEEQLQTVGTKVEQLYSNVVPSSVDTMLSAVNTIFPGEDPDATACKKSELKDNQADSDDSMTGPVVFKSELKDHQVDNDDSKTELLPSAEMVEEVVSAGKFENSNLNLVDIITQKDKFFDEESSPIYDQPCNDEGPNATVCSPGSDVSSTKVELQENFNGHDKNTQSPKRVQLDESCVVIDKNDWFTPQVAAGNDPPKIKLPSPSTSRLRVIQRLQQIKSKTKSKSSKVSSIQKEQALALPNSSSNNDTWESEWEII